MNKTELLGIVLLVMAGLISLGGCQNPAIFHVSSPPTPALLRVTLTGLIDTPLFITSEYISEYPRFDRAAAMVCPDGIYETEDATWQGILLTDLFAAAHVQPEAQTFTVYSNFDDYKQTFRLQELAKKDIFLAVTKDYRPMTFHEGGLARIVVPEEWGFRWVRWVNRIEVN